MFLSRKAIVSSCGALATGWLLVPAVISARCEISQHSSYYHFKLWQFDGRDVPHDRRIDALVLVPQNIADTRDLGPLDFRISRRDFDRQRADSFRNYLHCALDGALHVINGGKASNEIPPIVSATPWM